MWQQVDPSLAMNPAAYYIEASEQGGEPPGRWWGPGAQALGFARGQVVERAPYELLFGGRKAPDGTPLGRPPRGGRKAAEVYTPGCWPQSRKRRRSAGGSCGPGRPARRGRARCSST